MILIMNILIIDHNQNELLFVPFLLKWIWIIIVIAIMIIIIGLIFDEDDC